MWNWSGAGVLGHSTYRRNGCHLLQHPQTSSEKHTEPVLKSIDFPFSKTTNTCDPKMVISQRHQGSGRVPRGDGEDSPWPTSKATLRPTLLLPSHHALPFSSRGKQNASAQRPMGPFPAPQNFPPFSRSPQALRNKDQQRVWKMTLESYHRERHKLRNSGCAVDRALREPEL